jgi:hypothetical protein
VNVAGRVVAQAHYSLAGYAEELRQRGLAALAEEDETGRAGVIFDLSWDHLSAKAKEVFAVLALAPGEDVGPNLVRVWLEATAEDGAGRPRQERLLAELANASLLNPVSGRAGRYRYHDRVRDYALTKLPLPKDEAMRKLPTWQGSVDDDFDRTYCTDTFEVPAEFVEDVKALDDIIGNGLRREFGQHLAKALRRDPTENDKEAAAYEAESRQLSRTKHFMANGHTFVPMDDNAMETALKLAEPNGGKLRSAWGILPIVLTVKTNFHPYPGARDENDREHLMRAEVAYDSSWKIDLPYWEHCKKRFASKYPLTMAATAEDVERYLARAA